MLFTVGNDFLISKPPPNWLSNLLTNVTDNQDRLNILDAQMKWHLKGHRESNYCKAPLHGSKLGREL